MVSDADGFCCPTVDSAECVGCGLCEQVCPVLADLKPTHEPNAWAAYSKDTDMRLSSSSGGVFTELARVVLAQGGAVCGAVYGEGFRVIHAFAENEQDLAPIRGAKYAQSDLGGIFPKIKARLDRGQQVLFSGTPCQVGGLLAFLRKPYENLTTVDFVCHGVPSPMVWDAFVKSLGDVASINLRAKDTGWSRYRYCHRMEAADGTRLIPNSESLYMKLFVQDYVNRTSCADCRFKGHARRSDLTIGDFWGIWEIAPEMDDDRGTSLVLVQSPRGEALWTRIRERLVVKPVSLEEACAQNPSIYRASPAAAGRAEVLAQIRAGGLDRCAGLFAPAEPMLLQKIRRRVSGLLRRMCRINRDE
jgi:coenzyme F420-reducing hydrogenase beta subunit